MVKINKSEVIPKPRYPTRSGVLKSSLNVKVERERGRLPQYSWQKEADKKLADARKMKRERNKKLIELTELDHNEVEQPGVQYAYKTSSKHDFVEAKPLKRKPFPTIAHNYTFWADLIFAPKSRERGMLLIVEGQAGGSGATLSSIRVQNI